jgi:hypothetical protein
MFSSTKNSRTEAALESAKTKITALVTQHLQILANKRQQGLKVDCYGVVDGRRWTKDCQYFVDEVVRPQLTDEEALAIGQAGLSEIANQLIEKPTHEECRRIQRSGDNKPIATHSSLKSAHVKASSQSLPSTSSCGIRPTISRGLIIRPEPLDNILTGRKVWEMRSRSIEIRGTIALVKKGSKAVFGVADIVDSRGPLTHAEMVENQPRHLIPPSRLGHPDVAKYRHAWVLGNVRCLKAPIPYIHTGGVQFVTLDDLAVNRLASALGD